MVDNQTFGGFTEQRTGKDSTRLANFLKEMGPSHRDEWLPGPLGESRNYLA